MAYVINKTNGSIFATVADGTVDTSSTITVVGRNYSGYGEFLGENFVKLLENSSHSAAPSSPLAGQLWYDSANTVLNVYNGTEFKPISSVKVSGSEPATSLTSGDLWFDSGSNQLNIYNGSSFTLVGPPTSVGTGTSGPEVVTVRDSGGTDHVILKFTIEDEVQAYISNDAVFTPQVAITGFATISPGFQLSTTLTSGASAQFQGTASNAALLDSLDSTDFLRATANDTTTGTLGILNDSGLTIGADSDFGISVTGSDVTIKNVTSDGDMIFSINDGGVTTNVLRIDGATGHVYTDTTGAVDIGSVGNPFRTLYATATSAQYADLAERFEADAIYEAGTVVEMGGINEITRAIDELTDNVFGVISTSAAYLMNCAAGSNETHPPIAMNGRVPVKVIGVVHKGDRLVSAGNGYARTATEHEITAFNVIGRSLENKTDVNKGTVEAIVKVN
jgi:hypothetical protein